MNLTVEWSMDLLVRLGLPVVIKQASPCTSPTSAGSGFIHSHCRFVVWSWLHHFLFRSVTLDYEKEVTDAGVPAYRYAATEKVFANATVHPDNWCFCSGGACNPSGIGNSSTCRFGAPVFTSYPHYYLADPYYIDQVEGLRPEKDLHQFYIDLEPVSLLSVS